MIVMYLEGGLGNLLFQVSTALSLAMDHRVETVYYLNGDANFQKIRFAHNADTEGYFKTFFKNTPFAAPPIVYQPQIWHTGTFEYKHLDYEPDCYNIYKGYFQSEKFFSHNIAQIAPLFVPPQDVAEDIARTYPFLTQSHCASVHVRRGDYVNLPYHHPVLPLEYYWRALQELEPIDHILVFTNDVPWCQRFLRDDRMSFVQEPDWKSLYIMAQCKSHIIANSSFSWWGAKLAETSFGESNVRVCAPKTWFGPAIQGDTKDLTPERWKKL